MTTTTTIASTAIAVRPGAVVTTTTTITTIVSQNPCQTIITTSSPLMNLPKPVPAASATVCTTTTSAAAVTSATVVAATAVASNAVAAAAAKTGASFTNLTTCNPQYLRSMQSSSYHRRHSVSGTLSPPTLCLSLSRSLSHTNTQILYSACSRDNMKTKQNKTKTQFLSIFVVHSCLHLHLHTHFVITYSIYILIGNYK